MYCVAGIIKRHGTGAALQAAKASLKKEQLETAFFVAVDLVLADGVVEACRDRAKALSEVGNQGQWTDLKVCPY